MAHPLLQKLMDKKAAAAMYSRTAAFVIGVAQDFWKDGSENPLKGIDFKAIKLSNFKDIKLSKIQAALWNKSAITSSSSMSSSSAPGQPKKKMEWHALAGEISEKMWGEGCVTPGDDVITAMLLKPFALNKTMSLLDLSAGLGTRMRKATSEFGVFVTGLEPDEGIAARGMDMSARAEKGKLALVKHYVPAEFTPNKTVTQIYDCVIARETFYRVPNKQELFAALAVVTKPQAQVSFTDYLVNPEDREKPAIVSWLQHETGAQPLSLVEMAETWAKAGFKLRVHDDQTDFYHKEILAGLQRFALFLKGSPPPDMETRKALMRRMEVWGHRLAALDQGMKFYRFYGTK